MYSVYILFSKKLNRYYVGYTNNIERRLSEHNRKKGKYTDAGIPWKLVYTEKFENKIDATKRENFIKLKKSRKYIESLIANEG